MSSKNLVHKSMSRRPPTSLHLVQPASLRRQCIQRRSIKAAFPQFQDEKHDYEAIFTASWLCHNAPHILCSQIEGGAIYSGGVLSSARTLRLQPKIHLETRS
ncbi:hypothetical protein TWF696_002692 [Orbilia brochopaga]|uniref:Uncharacterized protein n=1 Tax=Orbilia brochopaga TaxID=3140254 RepID=A0AAV9U5F9_9PEZI